MYAYVGSNPLSFIDPTGLLVSATLNAITKGPYRIPQHDANVISEVSNGVALVGATVAASPAIAGQAELAGRAAARMACDAVIRNKEPLKQLCKNGMLAGSVLCEDRQGKDAADDMLQNVRKIEEIKRSSRAPSLPTKELMVK